MPLETMEPNPVWVEDAYAETVNVFEAYGQDLVLRIWGGDWCKDCRAQLPDFGAALAAAEVPEDNIVHYGLDQDKEGPGVDEYDIEYIPTVVVEHNGEEVARFVEEESVPISVYLADEIEVALGSITDR
jgi:thiol-disulfide isomerase/thioredoxin